MTCKLGQRKQYPSAQNLESDPKIGRLCIHTSALCPCVFEKEKKKKKINKHSQNSPFPCPLSSDLYLYIKLLKVAKNRPPITERIRTESRIKRRGYSCGTEDTGRAAVERARALVDAGSCRARGPRFTDKRARPRECVRRCVPTFSICCACVFCGRCLHSSFTYPGGQGQGSTRRACPL